MSLAKRTEVGARAAMTIAGAEERGFRDLSREAEYGRGYLSNYLGTSAQIAGGGNNYVPGAAEYSQRYNVNSDVLQNLVSMGAGPTPKGGPIVASLNRKLDMAEEAARAGDFGNAKRLRAEAAAEHKGLGMNAQAFRLGGGSKALASERAHSPMGRLIGGNINRALGYAEGAGNEIYDKKYDDLTGGAIESIRLGQENAERGVVIAAQEREGQMRQTGNLRGAGRNPQFEGEQAARGVERDRTLLAQLKTQGAGAMADIGVAASQYMSDFAEAFGQNAIGMAEAFVDGTSGLRPEYMDRMERSFDRQTANLSTYSSQMMQMHSQAEAAEEAKDAAITSAIITGVIGIVTLGIGWALTPVAATATTVAGVGQGAGIAGMSGMVAGGATGGTMGGAALTAAISGLASIGTSAYQGVSGAMSPGGQGPSNSSMGQMRAAQAPQQPRSPASGYSYANLAQATPSNPYSTSLGVQSPNQGTNVLQEIDRLHYAKRQTERNY